MELPAPTSSPRYLTAAPTKTTKLGDNAHRVSSMRKGSIRA
jgi:hypothetical protein